MRKPDRRNFTMERKLASIQKIIKTEPIPNRDRIVLATVLGWHVIVRKEEMKPGDLVVYVETDSILPDCEKFADIPRDKRRIRMMKMAGVYSQGICFPLSILPNGGYKEGDDVTEVLGIKKYEPDERNSGRPWYKHANGPKVPKPWARFKFTRWLWKKFIYKPSYIDFPKGFVPKTDETRCLYGQTKVDTNYGPIKISKLVNSFHEYAGVKALSVSNNGKLEYKNIVDVQKIKFDPKKEMMYNVEFEIAPLRTRKNRVRCTEDHKFLTCNNKYKEAKDLAIGDVVFVREYSYGEDVIPFMYGAMLGDSGVCFDNRPTNGGSLIQAPIISFTQGEDQLEYLKLKQKAVGAEWLKLRKGKSGYCDKTVYQGTLQRDAMINAHLEEDGAVCNRVFRITEEYANRLTPMSLAIWYLDDGSLKHKYDENNSPNIIISSNSLTLEENEILVHRLNEMGYQCNIRKDKEYYGIYITVDGTKKFLKDITKFIPSSMRYKTTCENEDVEFVGFPSFKKAMHIVPVKITNISQFTNKNIHYVYDITVEDNHNFFAAGVLTHNCQLMQDVLDKYKGQMFTWTEKIDGSSITMWLDNKDKFHVCSRNREILTHDDFMYETAEAQLKSKLVKGYVYQGEIVGPNIQQNKYGLEKLHIYVYSVWVTRLRQYLTPFALAHHCSEQGIDLVPFADKPYENAFILGNSIDDLVERSKGNSRMPMRTKETPREGIVIRPVEYLEEKNDARFVGGRLSFKAINPDFMLKYKL